MIQPIITAAVLALAVPPALAQSSAPAGAVAGSDAFARAAAQNSLSEVLLAAMALQKTDDKRVQDDAWTMLDHHSRAMGDLAEALADGSAALPTEPSSDQQAQLRRLRGLSGQQFDQAYFTHQLAAHQRAIGLFDTGSRLPDQKLAHYARVTLPVLRAHREITLTRQAQPPQSMSQ